MDRVLQVSGRCPDKCLCGLLSSNIGKSAQFSAWENYEDVLSNLKQDSSATKNKKLLASRVTRFGYETQQDKYKFKHYDDVTRYLEEYTQIFSVANRTRNKNFRIPPSVYKVPKPPIQSYKCGSGFSSTVSHKPTLKTSPDEERPLSSKEDDEQADGIKRPRSADVTRGNPSNTPKPRIDIAQDLVTDESEDDCKVVPKVPLLKRLNTYLSSQSNRRKTPHTGMFPHISYESNSNADLTGMTPATLISYKIPLVITRTFNRPVSVMHKQSAFSQERQNSLVKAKLTSSGENTKSYMTAATVKTEELHANHILEAKTIPCPVLLKDSKSQTYENIMTMTRVTDKCNSNRERLESPVSDNQGVRLYNRPLSLHSYLTKLERSQTDIKASYSKVELFDFSQAFTQFR